MQFRSKLLLTTAISAAFLISPAPAGANLNATIGTPLTYSENTLSTQTILSQAGYLPPSQVNGYMDTTTRNAIASFQQAKGLPANGLIDPKTAELLNNSYTGAISQPTPAPQPAPQMAQYTPLAPTLPVEQVLYSSNALAIQQILYKLGFYRTTPNGYMDSQTRTAIMQFQTTVKLPVTGEIDMATADALNNAYAMGSAYQTSGVPRSPNEPYVSTPSWYMNKWVAGGIGVGALAGAAAAFGGGGGGSSSSSLNNDPIIFNIPSNDVGNQAYNGSASLTGFNAPDTSSDPANFLTGDAANSESIAMMNANDAHARGYDGRVYNRTSSGVLQNTTFDSYAIVAIFDSGIDLDHPDLVGNILVDDSVTCTNGKCVAGGEDTEGHGTSVAGVVAAMDNSVGTVGIAPQAKLLSVAFDLSGPSITAGYNYMNNKGVDVINNSFGSSIPIVTPTSPGTQDTDPISANDLRVELTRNTGGTNWLTEIQQAVAQHTILVWSAGNDGSNQPSYESSLPYYFDGNTNAVNTAGYDWRNNWVTSVSLNDSGTISSFSNRCGIAMEYCLATPGEVYTTDMNGAYDTNAEGTSFSAPNASGAIAVLLGAYPHLSPEKVLNILFETATDIGAPGTDVVYGRGLINLDAATNPTISGDINNPSPWSIAIGSNRFASFSSTGLNLSSAFGDAMLNNRQKVMFTDELERDFQVSLNSLARSMKETKTNEERLSEFGRGEFVQEISLDNGSELAFTLGSQNEGNLRASLSSDTKHDQNKFMLKQNFASSSKKDSPSFNTTLGYNVNAAEMLGFTALEKSNKDHLQISDAFKNPYLNLTDYASGASAGYEYHNFGVRVAGYEARDQREEYQFSDGNKTSGQLAEVYYSNNGLSLSVQAGTSHETNTFLGSEAGGALELDSESPTYFAGLAASYSPVEDVTIKANYNTGVTKLNTSNSSMISDVSNVESNSFGVGLEFANVNSANDKIGLSFSQPLRISSASAYASLPQDITVDGTTLYQDSRLNLTPGGREMDMEAYYNVSLSEASQLSLGSMLRMEPNHIEDADNEGLLLMKYRTEF